MILSGGKKRENTFYCFSPPVMIATFTAELVFAVYTILRYKFDLVAKLSTLILIFLAVFQISEYMVCSGSFAGLEWSRIGYAAITLLPPLGIHLACSIAKSKRHLIIWIAYLSSAIFMAFFLFVKNALIGHACRGNYVIFDVGAGLGTLYGAYYYAWLIAGIVLSWRFIQRLRIKKEKAALTALSIGYALFIIPTVAANIISPSTTQGIPSIMCGFAVIFAVVLTFGVLPIVGVKRTK